MPRLPRFPGPATSPGSFNVNGFKADNTIFHSSKNPYLRERISSDRFWSYPQRSYYSCIMYNQGRIFPHMRLDTEAIAGLPCLEEALIASKRLDCCPSSPTKSTGMKSCCSNFMPHFTYVVTTEIRRLGSWSG